MPYTQNQKRDLYIASRKRRLDNSLARLKQMKEDEGYTDGNIREQKQIVQREYKIYKRACMFGNDQSIKWDLDFGFSAKYRSFYNWGGRFIVNSRLFENDFKHIRKVLAETIRDISQNSWEVDYENTNMILESFPDRSLQEYFAVTFCNVISDKTGDNITYERCQVCRKFVILERSCRNYICTECGENYVWSECGDCYIDQDDAYYVAGDYYTANMLVSRGYFLNDDGEWEHGENIIGGYHSSKGKIGLLSRPSDCEIFKEERLTIGFELELVNQDGFTSEHNAKKFLNLFNDSGDISPYICAERDGSVDFELVSSYGNFALHETRLLRLNNSKIGGVLSHNGTDCGLHVHLSRRGMTLFHAAKLVILLCSPHSLKFVTRISRREPNGFCAGKSKFATLESIKRSLDDNSIASLNSSRYEIVNFQNRHTVEFRCFRGILKPETILASIQFARLAFLYADCASIANLKPLSFYSWILKQPKKENNYLKAYMSQRRINPQWLQNNGNNHVLVK